MRRVRLFSADEAVAMIENGSTIATGGFVGCAHPEFLTSALERHFLNTGAPNRLTLIYAAGQGDGAARGLNHFGHEGLLKRVIGGHWNLAPAMGKLALAGRIEAYNFPQGAISQLFREIASGSPGKLTRVGLGTFVDPRHDGGKLNSRTTEDLVSLFETDGKEWLFYKSFPIDFALLKGTRSDSFGNISFENEVITAEALSIAQAVRNSGGKVIVQIEAMAPDYSRDPKSIVIPGILVDGIVIAEPKIHVQTFAEHYNPNYVRQGDITGLKLEKLESGPRRIIAERALQEIPPDAVVNLGIGLPEEIARAAAEHGKLADMTLTIEAGPVGGVPAGGLSFGAAHFPQAIIDQPYMFDFYDGGGLDVAFLGLAECDRRGNVNVSKFNGRVAGIGGFMDIAQTAKKIVFTGTFTTGSLKIEPDGGKLKIHQEGKFKKFVDQVEHITFSGEYALRQGQTVLYITERAVFELIPDGLRLLEIAPGVDLEKDILAQMEFRPVIDDGLRQMKIHTDSPSNIISDSY